MSQSIFDAQLRACKIKNTLEILFFLDKSFHQYFNQNQHCTIEIPMNMHTLKNGEKIQCIDILTADYVYQEVFEDKVYFQNGIEIKNGDTVLDIGANIGLFSIFASRQAKDLIIYAFEPVLEIFNVLKENSKKIDTTIKIFNFGLGNKNELQEFHYFPKVSADSSAIHWDWEYKVNKYVEHYNETIAKDIPIAKIVPKFLRKFVVRFGLKRIYKPEFIECKIRPLSEIIEEENIKKIHLMKIDAENAEREVIEGIKDKDWEIIDQIAMEVHTHIPKGENLLEEIISLLESKGFEVSMGKESRESILGVYMIYAKKNR